MNPPRRNSNQPEQPWRNRRPGLAQPVPPKYSLRTLLRTPTQTVYGWNAPGGSQRKADWGHPTIRGISDILYELGVNKNG